MDHFPHQCQHLQKFFQTLSFYLAKKSRTKYIQFDLKHRQDRRVRILHPNIQEFHMLRFYIADNLFLYVSGLLYQKRLKNR